MYLSIDDLKKGMYQENLNVVSRGEENVLQAIVEAEAEVASYLSVRYDMATELAKPSESADRIPIVVKLVRDIALYNCCCVGGAVNIPEFRGQRYKESISYLKEVQAERAQIQGLQRLNATSDGGTSSSYASFGGSNTKRDHHI
ncbi:hypothetical protein FACS1894199_11480 [Bacteroidia bacterium]|nr:hypothetical protein FACS1894199_11480 [Bacteroidia bacterium]